MELFSFNERYTIILNIMILICLQVYNIKYSIYFLLIIIILYFNCPQTSKAKRPHQGSRITSAIFFIIVTKFTQRFSVEMTLSSAFEALSPSADEVPCEVSLTVVFRSHFLWLTRHLFLSEIRWNDRPVKYMSYCWPRTVISRSRCGCIYIY